MKENGCVDQRKRSRCWIVAMRTRRRRKIVQVSIWRSRSRSEERTCTEKVVKCRHDVKSIEPYIQSSLAV